MSAAESLAFENDPLYLASLEDAMPPWRAGWSTEKPPAVLGVDNETIVAHLGIVDNAVAEAISSGYGVDPEEARQDGAVGLCDGGSRYNPSMPAKFSTFVRSRVRGEIIDGVRRYNKLAGPNRKEPRVVSLLNGTRARSLDAPAFTLGHGGSMNLHDTIPAKQPSVEEVTVQQDETKILYDAIAQLASDRQRQAILLSLRQLSQRAIAESLGVSTSTVSTDLQKAREALRQILEPQLRD